MMWKSYSIPIKSRKLCLHTKSKEIRLQSYVNYYVLLWLPCTRYSTYTIVYISQNRSYTPVKLFIAYLKIGKIQAIADIMYQERHSRLKIGKIVAQIPWIIRNVLKTKSRNHTYYTLRYL